MRLHCARRDSESLGKRCACSIDWASESVVFGARSPNPPKSAAVTVKQFYTEAEEKCSASFNEIGNERLILIIAQRSDQGFRWLH